LPDYSAVVGVVTNNIYPRLSMVKQLRIWCIEQIEVVGDNTNNGAVLIVKGIFGSVL